MPANTTLPLTRASNACESCRRRKVKCSGSQPCLTCTRHGFECRFGTIARRGYSEANKNDLTFRSYVQNLVKTIKGLEEKLEEVSRKSSLHPPDSTSI
ncbi:Trehalose phosphorylase [Fusarium oxysporum f. sp. albedinis]|nr:Trehalose phosphorylase [Fusarium oxysporum f. sp. albedinis]